jgi:hypothetical protein
MMRLRRLWIIPVLVLAAAPVFGQEHPAFPSVEHRVLLLVSIGGDAAEKAEELTLLSRSLLVALQTNPAVEAAGTLLVDSLGSEVPSDDTGRAVIAREKGADGWLWIQVTQMNGSVHLGLRAVDLARPTEGLNAEMDMAGDILPLDVPALDWSPAAQKLVEGFGPREGDAPPTSAPGAPANTARVVVHARPGSTISVKGMPSVKVDAEGTATVTLPVPAEYTVRAAAPGFAPLTRELFVSFDRDVSMVQAPGARWSFAASLADFAYPGASLSWLFIPDWVFLTAGFTTYVAGLAFNQTDVISSSPLTNVTLLVGAYLAPADSALRPYVAVGGFLRAVDAPVYVGLDPLSPGGLQLALGLEVAGKTPGRFFLELGPQLLATQYPSLLQASLGAGKLPPGWVFGTWGAADLLSLRVGYRWKL